MSEWIEKGRYHFRVHNGSVIAIITRTAPSSWHRNKYGRKTFMLDSFSIGEVWSDSLKELKYKQTWNEHAMIEDPRLEWNNIDPIEAYL